jgi:hypothetical protein
MTLYYCSILFCNLSVCVLLVADVGRCLIDKSIWGGKFNTASVMFAGIVSIWCQCLCLCACVSDSNSAPVSVSVSVRVFLLMFFMSVYLVLNPAFSHQRQNIVAHYFFQTEESAEMFMGNIADSLENNGMFYGTYACGDAIAHLLEDQVSATPNTPNKPNIRNIPNIYQAYQTYQTFLANTSHHTHSLYLIVFVLIYLFIAGCVSI